MKKVYEFIFASLFFLKHFKGSQYCEKTDKIEEKIFMDEQEWRSIKLVDEDLDPFYINENSDSKRNYYNEALTKLSSNKLEFNCDDIRYIIVEKEEDVIQLINDINCSNYDDQEKSLLISKISVLNHLREDFM
ncbi:hypothetical protein GA597_02755 [Staphylococcus haemolyticus]|nr:hypothetical protein GA597_02755 [Staphylococcus haemolyticus]